MEHRIRAQPQWRDSAALGAFAPEDRPFIAVLALLFAACAAATAAWCTIMPGMGGLPMPGGWAMSMSWIRMPSQSWPGNALAFTLMWTSMMVAMMLPSLLPVLLRYRRGVAAHAAAGIGGMTRPAYATQPRAYPAAASLMAGYFGTWTALEIAVYAGGALIASAAMEWPALSRALPVAGAAAVIIAGLSQFTQWKARQLACCRATPGDAGNPSNPNRAFMHGAALGLHCIRCCAGPMTVLLVLGVMDLRAMIAVTAAITAERLAPDGARAARVTGALAVATGLFLLAYPPSGGCT